MSENREFRIPRTKRARKDGEAIHPLLFVDHDIDFSVSDILISENKEVESKLAFQFTNPTEKEMTVSARLFCPSQEYLFHTGELRTESLFGIMKKKIGPYHPEIQLDFTVSSGDTYNSSIETLVRPKKFRNRGIQIVWHIRVFVDNKEYRIYTGEGYIRLNDDRES